MKEDSPLDEIRDLRKQKRIADEKICKNYSRKDKDEAAIAVDEFESIEADYHVPMTKIISKYCDENFINIPTRDNKDKWKRSKFDGQYYLTDSGINEVAQNISAYIKTEKEFSRQGLLVLASLLSGIGGLIGALIGSWAGIFMV